MLDTEAAETLMSLSAPDERKFTSPLYQEQGFPWHNFGPSSSISKKRSFHSFNLSPSSNGNSLPNTKGVFMETRSFNDLSISLLEGKHREPLDNSLHDEEVIDDGQSDEDIDIKARSSWSSRSPFDGLVAAATSNQDDNDNFVHSASRPISIPNNRGHHKHHHKWSLSRVKEDASFIGRDCSPTGVEDERLWSNTIPQHTSSDDSQRVRLGSICSSEGGMSDYGGLGRKHLEEFIRMEISAAHEMDHEVYDDNQLDIGSPIRQHEELRFIGSYSPEARRKRIERFLEKRKKRVWSKKVDYDVRKNFANSRLRVKGRFVKKEDEELLCQLLSYT